MQAETLNCPMCGAAAANDAVRCLYCSARLATIACPSCFGMMFTGSRHCPRCGALGQHAEVKTDDEHRACPRCRVALDVAEVGTMSFRECGRCGGVWVEAAAFERMCSDREQQAAVAGVKVAKSVEAQGGAGKGGVRYVPCPECGQLMNRTNFARCSGVVVDVCKAHGTWFDRDELQRIVEFIRAGGMSAARRREIEQLAEERRRLRQEQLSAADADAPFGWRDEIHQSSVGLAATELLKMLID